MRTTKLYHANFGMEVYKSCSPKEVRRSFSITATASEVTKAVKKRRQEKIAADDWTALEFMDCIREIVEQKVKNATGSDRAVVESLKVENDRYFFSGFAGTYEKPNKEAGTPPPNHL